MGKTLQPVRCLKTQGPLKGYGFRAQDEYETHSEQLHTGMQALTAELLSSSPYGRTIADYGTHKMSIVCYNTNFLLYARVQ